MIASDEFGWMSDAACRGLDPALFFPERGDDVRPALKVCAACPVKAECLELGLVERHGVYGGLSERQRRKVRKAHYLANGRVLACSVCGEDFHAPENGPSAKYCSATCRLVGARERQHEYYNRSVGKAS